MDKTEHLELELDLRLKELWDLVGEKQVYTQDDLGTYVRAAYGLGYRDAVKAEDHEWIDKLGYKI